MKTKAPTQGYAATGYQERPKRISITPTYDECETGKPYTVTTEVNGKSISVRDPISDPFVRTTTVLSWRDVLKAALRWQRVTVTVRVNGNRDRVEDVLELNANYLGNYNCTRRDEFNQRLETSLQAVAVVEEATEIIDSEDR